MTQLFDLQTGVTDGQQVGKRGKLPEEWLKNIFSKVSFMCTERQMLLYLTACALPAAFVIEGVFFLWNYRFMWDTNIEFLAVAFCQLRN